MEVRAYTDASYSAEKDIAACGYCVLIDGKLVKHEVVLVQGLGQSAAAEIFAMTAAMQHCFMIKDVSVISISTDHQGTVLGKRRQKIYKEFNETLEMIEEYGIAVNFRHVKGHSTNAYNIMVDESCLKNLRKHIYNNESTSRKTKRWYCSGNRR